MRFLRTNTAVIITCGPLYDKTDGVTIEGALTISNERITLTADTDDGSAPTLILDNVTGATSGTANDLNYITNTDAGLLQLELSAANVNRLGRMFLSITDAANHVPVFHEFMVLPAAIYDWFIAGTVVPLPANVTTIAGSAVSTSTAQLGVNAVQAGGTAWGSGAITAGSIATDAITATKIAADAIGASELAADAVTEIQSGLATAAALDAVDNFIDTEIGTIISTLGSPAGASLAADIAAIEAQTDDIGTAGAGLTAVPWNAAWDAEVQSECTDALNAYDPPTNTEMEARTIAAASYATAAALDTVDNFLDTEIAAIKAKTDLIPGTIDGKTFSELVTLIAAVLLGKASGLATTTAVYRAVDDSKDRVTGTVDEHGNRSAIVLDAA